MKFTAARWLLICLILPLAAVGKGVVAADAPPSPLVRVWIDECKRANGVEFLWADQQDVLTEDGEVAYSFDVNQTVRVHWPHAMELRSRVVQTGDQRESAAAVRFDRDFTVTGAGVVSETFTRRSESNTSMVGASARRLGVVAVSFAPSLLGVWLEDESPDAVEFDRVSADSFRVHFKNLRMRAVVQRRTDAAGRAMTVVSRLESVSSDGTPTQWWEYDDFARVDGRGGEGVGVGRVRVWFSSLHEGRIHESVPAVLTGVRVTGLGESVSFEELSDSGEGAYEARLAEVGPARSGRRMLISAGPIVLWVGAGALLVAVGIVVIGRVRS